MHLSPCRLKLASLLSRGCCHLLGLALTVLLLPGAAFGRQLAADEAPVGNKIERAPEGQYADYPMRLFDLDNIVPGPFLWLEGAEVPHSFASVYNEEVGDFMTPNTVEWDSGWE